MAQKHDVSCIEKPMTVATTEQGPQKRYRRLRFPSFNADVWAEKNPLLQKGELGHEKDTGRFKVGDGVTYWLDLPYNSVGEQGEVGPQGEKGDPAKINGYNTITIQNGNNIDLHQEEGVLTISTKNIYNQTEIDDKVAVINTAIDANADAIQATREDFTAADTELQNQITARAGEISTLRNDLDGVGDQVAVIESKIPESTTSSNQLVNASQLTAESQDIRADYMQADSELQTQINGQATAITTNKNDIDGLGDQVSAIEEKIPATASAENPLVTRSEISSVYKFKGSVATYNDLPTGATVGDVYNVTDTGANYAWGGSAWDKLSETVDLSSYATTAYVNAREQDIRDDYMQADSELQTQINGLSSAVATNQSNISGLRTDVGDLENQVEANHNDITAHIADTSNPHNVTKTQVGLGNVDNTSDANKPVSTAQQAALNLKADKSTTYSKTEVDDLLAPKLDSETAEDTYATITNLNAHTSNTSNPHSVTKTQVGLGNVDNTSDLNKPVSTAQQAAINTAKQDVISGYTTADGELQQQINGQATAISTNTSNITALTTRVGTNETNITLLDSDVDTINTDLATAKTDITNLKSSVNSQAGLIQGLQDDVSEKVDKNQGTANAGKILSVGSDGQVTLTSAPGGGLTAVAHDSTLTGTGADSSPLGIASTVLAEIADKAEQTTVETLSGVVSQNTTNIGTLRTDVDDLGDQVSGIESKIPASASSTNLLATKSEIPTVPTNVSAFNNDSGYITSSALTPYATTQALNDGLATKQPTGDYATNSALTSGLALKVAIAQGSENAGKILKIDDNGNVIVADESGGGASLPILYHTWSDHLLNNISWLRADTFSWQSGDVYKAAYEHLVSDLEGTTAESETISGVTIVFYRAEDGHKICTASHESLVRLLYDVTGVAWYFILDTENKQFKLPRTKWGFTGLRDSVGGYVEPGLPNITGQVGQIDFSGSRSFSGVFINVSSPGGDTGATHSGGTRTTVGFDASNSSAIYGNSDTVQPPATQMYLYFYVGNFEQSAIEQTAGITSEQLNQKADVGFGNVSNAAKELMANSSMPSEIYTNLTLSSSGSRYTAPADGWFALGKTGNSGQMINMENQLDGSSSQTMGSRIYSAGSGLELKIYLPARKGDVVYVSYTASGVTNFFRFIYAEGTKHLA